ncbi:MAG: phosphoglucomutase [Treponema sp.]|nr:phosphoglucomutase [Treponema sp.]
MILSASGWRKVFAVSGDEQDKTPEISSSDTALSVIAAETFFDYAVKKTGQEFPVIAIGMDTRPTGSAICDAMIKALVCKKAVVQFTGITSAPEIMAFSKKIDGFIYISASHNPVGHNGIKFGMNDGGVLNAQENAILTEEFKKRLEEPEAENKAFDRISKASSSEVRTIYQNSKASKFNALRAYEDFAVRTISGSEDKARQNDFFEEIRNSMLLNPIGVVCDFNGSSRTLCIDRDFFGKNKIKFYEINSEAGNIVHEIIPEAENLVHVAAEMERLHKEGHNEVLLGYMPDCDGDRGNIVYWDEKQQKACILKAQEVFSLSVLAELTYSVWCNSGNKDFRPAVCVNCPTSMRIEEIASKLEASVFRAEVGEANVVNLAREKREEGFTVPILGEGSNGGTITYPASVRDPLNTIFALLKLLTMRGGGLYELWCSKSGNKYKDNYTLSDILESLPKYTTTGVSEQRAVLKVPSLEHAELKRKFQKKFIEDWKKTSLKKKYGLESYRVSITNGTKERYDVEDWGESGKGGLKVLFYGKNKTPLAFIWMRGSGTEPVFRIMCDVKGDDIQMEKELLEWESKLLAEC